VEIFGFGAGEIHVADDGAVEQVVDPRGRQVLLDDDSLHAWGKGFVTTARGSQRFDQPVLMRWRQNGIDLLYQLDELELRVGRRFGDLWTETYELRNAGVEPVDVDAIAISTPYRGVYRLGTGSDGAWVWAASMDDSGPGLGLQLKEGEVLASSVEPGHLYLHVTDHTRTLVPGASYRWTWQLSWYDDLPSAFASGE
jgi:hypothetical protein